MSAVIPIEDSIIRDAKLQLRKTVNLLYNPLEDDIEAERLFRNCNKSLACDPQT
jgi:hypothetical protein